LWHRKQEDIQLADCCAFCWLLPNWHATYNTISPHFHGTVQNAHQQQFHLIYHTLDMFTGRAA